MKILLAIVAEIVALLIVFVSAAISPVFALFVFGIVLIFSLKLFSRK